MVTQRNKNQTKLAQKMKLRKISYLLTEIFEHTQEWPYQRTVDRDSL